MLDCNTSFERSLSKLSENHKIFDIGSTILKLRLLKDVQLHSVYNSLGIFSAAITWIPWIQCQHFLGFSKSLENFSSNGAIKNYIWEIKVFANLAILEVFSTCLNTYYFSACISQVLWCCTMGGVQLCSVAVRWPQQWGGAPDTQDHWQVHTGESTQRHRPHGTTVSDCMNRCTNARSTL